MKRFLTIWLIVAMVFCLGACGGSQGGDGGTGSGEGAGSGSDASDAGAGCSSDDDSAADTMEGAGDLGDSYVEIKDAVLAKTYDGEDAIVITYAWTNNSGDTTSDSVVEFELEELFSFTDDKVTKDFDPAGL